MPAEPVLVVGAALLDDPVHPTRLLAARRCAPSSLAGRWELPGGKVEDGETPEDALTRELREELGVDAEPLDVLVGPAAEGVWPLSRAYVMAVWFAALRSGVPAPLVEHDELAWVGADDWKRLDWLPGDVPAVAAAVRRLHAA